jgi:hypothetical protein
MGTHGIRSKFGTKRFKKVTRAIEDGFESKHFEAVASGTVKLAAVAAAQDAATLFLAAAEAFKIAKEAEWREKPENVTSQAYRKAREVRKFRISRARVADVKDSLKRTLDEYTSSQSGGS